MCLTFAANDVRIHTKLVPDLALLAGGIDEAYCSAVVRRSRNRTGVQCSKSHIYSSAPVFQKGPKFGLDVFCYRIPAPLD